TSDGLDGHRRNALDLFRLAANGENLRRRENSRRRWRRSVQGAFGRQAQRSADLRLAVLLPRGRHSTRDSPRRFRRDLALRQSAGRLQAGENRIQDRRVRVTLDSKPRIIDVQATLAFLSDLP